MNDAIYARLTEAARRGKTVTYADVGTAGELDVGDPDDMARLVKELEAIAEHETAAGRPLLVVLVAGADTNMPGKGLFKGAKKRKIDRGEDDMTFFIREMKRVHDYWKNAPA